MNPAKTSSEEQNDMLKDLLPDLEITSISDEEMEKIALQKFSKKAQDELLFQKGVKQGLTREETITRFNLL